MKRGIVLILALNLMALSCFSQSNLNETYHLMPWPKDIKENTSRFIINSNLKISILEENQGRVRNAAINFLRRLSGRTGVFLDEGFPVKSNDGNIQITFDSISKLHIDNDESYALHINDTIISINAKTDVGALRGLETLLQLTTNNTNYYYFPGVTIKDSPRFVWRGLMIDVSRHFQPIEVLKRNLRAMASVKMNVFHWHLTDDQGFRVESKWYPKLQNLASDGLYYTQDQIRDIIEYASNLGIRVVPEFDVPGHASALLTAYPNLGSKANYTYAIERHSGVFNPTLDPTNNETYEFLDNLFTEMAALFPDEYFHIGGDENEGLHWDENSKIQAFMVANNLKTNHDLQTYFNIKLEKILRKNNKKLMGWDEIMTQKMPTSAIIHSWRGENEGIANGGMHITAAKAGYKTVLSNGFYIDRMLSVEHHYITEPIGDVELTEEARANILGGEATMWTELVTPLTIDSRIWPRTAAIAERFWSNQEVNDVENMKLRLKDINYKLEELGITHIRNRDVILRSMANNQDISSLVELSKICEPLKIYTRNKDGIEYKSFSPFTLFADACVVDAEDAVIFNEAVKDHIKNPSKATAQLIKMYLSKWSIIYLSFQKINNTPSVKALEPLFINLSKVSKLLLISKASKNVSVSNKNKLERTIKTLKEPVMDVELAIVHSLEKLVEFYYEDI